MWSEACTRAHSPRLVATNRRLVARQTRAVQLFHRSVAEADLRPEYERQLEQRVADGDRLITARGALGTPGVRFRRRVWPPLPSAELIRWLSDSSTVASPSVAGIGVLAAFDRGHLAKRTGDPPAGRGHHPLVQLVHGD